MITQLGVTAVVIGCAAGLESAIVAANENMHMKTYCFACRQHMKCGWQETFSRGKQKLNIRSR